ncbi:hypothetical protein OPV22_005896 [Ensete ventricosum]|uniref:Peptidyl-prolyl cis-trans isomerase n=1 Tax=Ensete ventricosum TaxID=4639 RepID=A0AAV8RQ58_ENSVE|nr:hypothetical protein OPV22_005896 [Ensete ventricosum]
MAKIKPQALLLQSKKKKGPARISLSTIISCNVIVILIVLSLYATYRHWYHRSNDQLDTDLEKFEHSEIFGESTRSDLPSYAIFSTAKGLITIELSKDSSRDVVDKFVDLCRKGYFKGMLFDHVIKNFVIQGAHSQRSGVAEDWIPKGKAHSRLGISPKHEAFVLGTRKPNKDSKEFELFITTAPIPDLNEKLTVFGRVIKGEDVVQEIEEVDTDEHYRPKSPVGIIDIALKQEA